MAEAEIIGYVMERTGQRARVKIDKSKSTKQNLPKFLDCWNACEEKIGTQVRVEVQTLSTKKAKMTIYGVPVLALAAGLAFGNGFAGSLGWDKTWTIIGSGVLWLLIGWKYSSDFRRDAARKGEQYVITGAYYGDVPTDTVTQSDMVKDEQKEGKRQGDE